jgi:hypothetical protein
MKATLPIFALVAALSTQAFGASNEDENPTYITNPFYRADSDTTTTDETTPTSGGTITKDMITTTDDGLIKVGDRILPEGSSYRLDDTLGVYVFTMPMGGPDDYEVFSEAGIYTYTVVDNKVQIMAALNDGTGTKDAVTVVDNPDGTVTVKIGDFETKNYPAGTTYYFREKDGIYIITLPEDVGEPEAQKDEEPGQPVIPVEPKKPVVVHPTLAIHNVFRNNMFSVLNRIKPYKSVTSDKQYYVQSFKGTKTSRIESTTTELNKRVYIESTSLYSNVKNKETLRQTGGTVGFDYENIGFCFTDLTGELNQYDLDSRLYSVYAGFNDQHKLVLSYGDHELENLDGDSYGALYEFNYNNFVADVAYTNTKFDQESLKTYMVGVGYTVSGNVVGPINGSIKGMVIQDFGDHKDQYGAKQGSTGILVSGMLQTNLTDNLGVYLMASGEVRRHATGASAALGLEYAF